MARGWESKSVEDQVQQSQSKTGRGKKGQSSPAEIDANRRREVLLLSRKRVERELESSQNPRYKEQLNRALADLDNQLANLAAKD
jgi:hypothetical protein